MSLITEFPKIIEESNDEYRKLKGKSIYISEEINMGNTQDSGNILCHGDNLLFMKNLLDNGYKEKINLIYIDPPFFSKSDYDAVIKVGNKTVKHLAYEDSWRTGIFDYLKMMTIRLMAMRDLLTEDGTIWVHLDWHVVHYVKILMDEIFGEKNFVNEIVWTYKSGGTSKKHFARKHDTILVYSKSNKYFFQPLKEKSYNRQFKPYRFKGVKEYRDEIGWYTMVNMKDVWNLDMVGRTSKERTGYATQKPEALVERILESATREGDLCADFFCGSGTLPAVSGKMGRRFIACDAGGLAVESTAKRLAENNESFRVFSFDKKRVSRGRAIFDIKYDQITFSDDFLVTLDLKGYKIYKLEKYITDAKGIDKSSLDLVESWSIDFNYDGFVHRPEMIFLRDRAGIQTSCEKIMGQKSSISIKVVDVFGNYNFIILDE